MARTRNNIPRPKLMLLSHFRAKKSIAPTPGPTPKPIPTPAMSPSPKEPHVGRLSPQIGPKSRIGHKRCLGPKSRIGPKVKMGPKSQIRTNPIEDSGKPFHVRRLFLGKEQIIEASKKLNFDIEYTMQKCGITRFQVIRTLKKHRAALEETFESMKKEIENLENSP